MDSKEICEFKENKVKPYSAKVLTGNWQDAQSVPDFDMTTEDPLPSKNPNGYKTTHMVNYTPILGFKKKSAGERKLKYLTELPFQGCGLGSSVEYASALWISEMKDKYRDPSSQIYKEI